ncbi:MAG: flavodoxin family protein [Clostridia bacterium]|nr:flavodoxin family protein [Clostridia bacterium]
MSGVIYYFSGTGNSLYVAKLLSDELNFSYRSMSKSMNDEVTFESSDQMVR